MARSVQNKISEINRDQQFIRPSTMDWTEDAELHRRYLDWEEEVRLLMEGPLSDGGKKPASIKVNYLLIWIGQQARDHCKTIHPELWLEELQRYPRRTTEMDKAQI